MFMADRIAVMRAGRNLQTAPPDALYCQPANAFVAEFFSEVNRINGVVENGAVETPFGALSAKGLAEGAVAEILIRPEALKLSPVANNTEDGSARVLAARMLGRTSLIHLCTCQQIGDEIHLHARVPGRFLPEEDEVLQVTLDPSQAFVFPASAD